MTSGHFCGMGSTLGEFGLILSAGYMETCAEVTENSDQKLFCAFSNYLSCDR